AAAQNVFGTRETEPQILAAWDKNVRAPVTCANNVGKMCDAHPQIVTIWTEDHCAPLWPCC
ncbi:MAG: hypothetical protein WCK27_17530, partial [Verrucomicrobiota bacterium]